jgi:hypothetical protein
MSVWDGPPLDLSKYTDDELTFRLAAAKADIITCEQYENWKPTLKAEEHWIEWELNRRKESQ